MKTGTSVRRTQLARLAGNLVDLSVDQPFGLYMARSGDPLSTLATELERTVFEEAFGDSPELLAKEYEPYEESSIFFFVLDHRRGSPVGMARIILPSVAGLKTVKDLEPWWGQSYEDVCERTGIPCLPGETWDVATLAVAPEYRGAHTMSLVSASLYQALSMTAMRCSCDWYLATLHVSVLRMLQWKLCRPFGYFDGLEARDYLGSPNSLPVYGQLSSWHEQLARRNPGVESLVRRGSGLEDEVRPPNWDEVGNLVGGLLDNLKGAPQCVSALG